jgi:cytochrome c oxidase cbb3-type subunit 1
MAPYWFLRTLSGISMDIGMSLLVINMMMTALTAPAVRRALPAGGVTPVPVAGAAR